MEPKKYTKKPVTIEAMQWDGTAEGATGIIEWILRGGGTATYACMSEHCVDDDANHDLQIHTLEGPMFTGAGNWVIRGIKGEFYSCRDDIFRESYDQSATGAPVMLNPRPVPPVAAMLLTPDNHSEVAYWCDGDAQTDANRRWVEVPTRLGLETAYDGQWVVKEAKDGYYFKVYPADVLARDYEL